MDVLFFIYYQKVLIRRFHLFLISFLSLEDIVYYSLCIHIIELTFFPYAKVYPAFVHATGMTTVSLLAFKIMIKMILITLCVVITCRISLIRKVYGYKSKGSSDAGSFSM